MPGPLPHPSPRRRNHRASAWTLPADDVERGPELPPEGPDGAGWCPQTQAWWQGWRTSPQAQTFLQVDWDALLIPAVLHHRMWTEHRPELAAEIRLWSAKFGATPHDRARTRTTIEPPRSKEMP